MGMLGFYWSHNDKVEEALNSKLSQPIFKFLLYLWLYSAQ